MPILREISPGEEYKFEDEIYRVSDVTSTFVLMRSHDGKILDMAPLEFKENYRDRKITSVVSQAFHVKFTEKEKNKIKLLETYLESALNHPSGSPTSPNTAKDVIDFVKQEHPKLAVMSHGWLKNHITKLLPYHYNYSAFVLSKRPEYRQTNEEIENERLMFKAIQEKFLNSQVKFIKHAYPHYEELFRKSFGAGATPLCLTSFQTFYNEKVSREQKYSRFGKKHLYDNTYVTTAVMRTERAFELVEYDTKVIHGFFRSPEPDEEGLYTAKAIKLVLYTGIDAHSSALLGWYMSDKAENGEGVMRTIRHTFNTKGEKLGGIPDELRFDNGSGFIYQKLHNWLKDLGIQWDFARKEHGQDKPHVERFYRTLTTHFLSQYPGFVPKDPRNKNICLKSIKSQELWTVSEFLAEFEVFANNYNKRDYDNA